MARRNECAGSCSGQPVSYSAVRLVGEVYWVENMEYVCLVVRDGRGVGGGVLVPLVPLVPRRSDVLSHPRITSSSFSRISSLITRV